MCLGVPGKVVATYSQNGVLMGKVDFGGLLKEVCLAYVPDIQIGDYAIVHVGFAITRLDEESAKETLALLRAMRSLDEEFPPDGEPAGEAQDAVLPDKEFIR